MPASTIESTIAGPACCAAASPVSTKMPVPMIAPMPSVTRLRGPSTRFRECSPVAAASALSCSIDFVAQIDIRWPRRPGLYLEPEKILTDAAFRVAGRHEVANHRDRIGAGVQHVSCRLQRDSPDRDHRDLPCSRAAGRVADAGEADPVISGCLGRRAEHRSDCQIGYRLRDPRLALIES